MVQVRCSSLTTSNKSCLSHNRKFPFGLECRFPFCENVAGAVTGLWAQHPADDPKSSATAIKTPVAIGGPRELVPVIRDPGSAPPEK
jgi:hypothetical protein